MLLTIKSKSNISKVDKLPAEREDFMFPWWWTLVIGLVMKEFVLQNRILWSHSNNASYVFTWEVFFRFEGSLLQIIKKDVVFLQVCYQKYRSSPQLGLTSSHVRVVSVHSKWQSIGLCAFVKTDSCYLNWQVEKLILFFPIKLMHKECGYA